MYHAFPVPWYLAVLILLLKLVIISSLTKPFGGECWLESQ
jgi:hypothetical protein